MSIAVMPLEVCTSAVEVVVMPLGALVSDTLDAVPSALVNALEYVPSAPLIHPAKSTVPTGAACEKHKEGYKKQRKAVKR